MDISSTSTQMSTSTEVALHTRSGELNAFSVAGAENLEVQALTELFQLTVATDEQLSTAMSEAVTCTQRVAQEGVQKFESLAAVNDDLRARVIQSTSRLEQLARVNQVQQEAFDNQLQDMQRQIARLEQEKAEMLRQRNEETAAAARRQIEAMQVASEATRAQIEALNRAHVHTLSTMRCTHASAIKTLEQSNATLKTQLTQSVDHNKVAVEEITRLTGELSQTQNRLASVSASLAVHEAAEAQRVAQAQALAARREWLRKHF